MRRNGQVSGAPGYKQAQLIWHFDDKAHDRAAHADHADHAAAAAAAAAADDYDYDSDDSDDSDDDEIVIAWWWRSWWWLVVMIAMNVGKLKLPRNHLTTSDGLYGEIGRTPPTSACCWLGRFCNAHRWNG